MIPPHQHQTHLSAGGALISSGGQYAYSPVMAQQPSGGYAAGASSNYAPSLGYAQQRTPPPTSASYLRASPPQVIRATGESQHVLSAGPAYASSYASPIPYGGGNSAWPTSSGLMMQHGVSSGLIGSASPAGGVYMNQAQVPSGIHYTSEVAQRYQPAGCQPVATFPHGITTIYATDLVPAFMALPEVRISPSGIMLGGNALNTAVGGAQ